MFTDYWVRCRLLKCTSDDSIRIKRPLHFLLILQAVGNLQAMSIKEVGGGTAVNHPGNSFNSHGMEKKKKCREGAMKFSGGHIFVQTEDSNWLLSGYLRLTGNFFVYTVTTFFANDYRKIFGNTSVK